MTAQSTANQAAKILDVLMLKIATAQKNFDQGRVISSEFNDTNLVRMNMLSNMNFAKKAIENDPKGTHELQKSIVEKARDFMSSYNLIHDPKMDIAKHLSDPEGFAESTGHLVMLAVNLECDMFKKGNNNMAKKTQAPKVIKTSAATEGGSSVQVSRPS